MASLPGRRPDLLLELDLTREPAQVDAGDLVGQLRTRRQPQWRAVLRTLHEAGTDDRVRGLVLKVGGAPGWVAVQELRDGVRALVDSGTPVWAWAETLGEGNGSSAYALASAATQIWLQPTGELALLGVSAETTFLRGALDRLGVVPELARRHEYKNAADRILNTELTPAHREALDRLTGSVWQWAVDAVAGARGLPSDRVRELADRSPLSASEAVATGLIDRLGYRDQVYAAARAVAEQAAGADVELRYADQWAPRARPTAVLRRRRPVVGLVDARGTIAGGRSGGGVQGRRLGSDTFSAALRAARDDDRTRAVVVRVDSPGGSAVASDTMWREMVLTRQAGKPVVVSMGSVAASGGYYISCPADVIVAQPSTITGSIGVLGGKVVVSGLLDRVGLSTGAVAHGEHARMYSAREGFTDSERERLEEMLDRVYADFLTKVGAGRRLSPDALDAVARGRVWSGADAARNGLVDELGGLRDAVRIARRRADLPDDAPVRPALQLSMLDRLGRPTSSEDPRAQAVGAPVWATWAGLERAAARVQLRAPEVRLR